MTFAVPVVKLHGARNDFILIDDRAPSPVTDYPAFARSVCDRHAGVGADGLLVVLPSDRAAVRMRIFNPDGSEAEMCGNGIRCLVRYLCENGEGERFAIDTMAGPIDAMVIAREPAFLVRADMGVPSFEAAAVGYERPGSVLDAALELPDGIVRFSGVSLGNPHAVVFTDDAAAVDLPRFGRTVGEHPAFATHVNAHAAQRIDRANLLVRHWERGAGATQACGTGAVAVAAAAIARGLVDSPVDVHVPGGTLRVEWDGTGHAFMTGEAVHVFDTAVAPASAGVLHAR